MKFGFNYTRASLEKEKCESFYAFHHGKGGVHDILRVPVHAVYLGGLVGHLDQSNHGSILDRFSQGSVGKTLPRIS